MEKLLLGIDIGTSACKVAAFTPDGSVIAQSAQTYPVYYPVPDCVEQDPREWWNGVCDGIRETLASGNINRGKLQELV